MTRPLQAPAVIAAVCQVDSLGSPLAPQSVVSGYKQVDRMIEGHGCQALELFGRKFLFRLEINQHQQVFEAIK